MKEERIARLPELQRVVGLRRGALYLLIKSGQFPKPVPLGRRAKGWLASEIQEWIESRVWLRDQERSKP